MDQPVVGPQHRQNCVGETQQQKSPRHPPPLPWGERATPLAITGWPQCPGLLRRGPLRPWQPISRCFAEIASQPQNGNGNAEPNRDNPSNEIAAHRPNIPRPDRNTPSGTRRTTRHGGGVIRSRWHGNSSLRNHRGGIGTEVGPCRLVALAIGVGGPKIIVTLVNAVRRTGRVRRPRHSLVRR